MSLRELLGTWEENAALFSPAQTVTGTVRSVEEYGVFVELMPNLCGLAELRDGAAPGKHCAVYIKSIIPERMKIKLIIIDTAAQIQKDRRCGTSSIPNARRISRSGDIPPNAAPA